MVIQKYNHVEQEQEEPEVRPIVAGGAEEDDHIDEQVQVQVLYGHGHSHEYDHDHNHNHNQQVEGKKELPVAEPDEQKDFDTKEGEEQVQVQVQVQRIQRMVQSVGTLDCLESVGHVLSIKCPPEPHAMQRSLEGSGP